MTTHYEWKDDIKELTIYDREAGKVVWCTDLLPSFEIAKWCADGFQELYLQGVRHGKQTVLEEMRRTIDHVDRSI